MGKNEFLFAGGVVLGFPSCSSHPGFAQLGPVCIFLRGLLKCVTAEMKLNTASFLMSHQGAGYCLCVGVVFLSQNVLEGKL